MNELEKYRNSTFDIEYSSQPHLRYAAREGFDAATALDLPVKFAKWRLKLENRMSKGEKSGDDLSRLWDKMDKYFNMPNGKTWKHTEENYYKYWIDNIYKPE